MKIPYGVSNFGEIRRGGYFYVDKTPFLPQLEDMGARYLLFLRPRRFGKSLFVSLLEHYYDLGRTEAFDELFSGLWIHQNPTPERARYLVLSLDFSQLAADGGQEALRRTFFTSIRSRVLDFLITYQARLPHLRRLEERLDTYQEAEALLSDLMSVVRASGHSMYVLIDEYDNFANRLLADGSHDLYTALVERTGFVRSFYATLKAGTGTGAVSRMFVTGVSPLLLDDLSSGFNIAAHVSDSPRLNDLAGFRHADVERAIDVLLTDRPELATLSGLGDRRSLLDVLERYYDGYRFSAKVSERVFNADMVLYYLRELDDHSTAPADMLDYNVRTDYRRLQRIGLITGTAATERRTLLESILAEGGIHSELVRQFGVRSLSSQSQFISLLYYLGMLTLGREPRDEPPAGPGHRLEIPNRVIRELQWEHLAFMLQDEANLVLDKADLDVALHAMAIAGDIAPFLALFHERVIKAMGLKDLRRFDEKSLKLMLLAF
ncbi:MAG TPA: AAA family ATPase, partial [Candidatus Nanopelagicales bacterium]|nr:AAA family ATPase [Candidatus Nanopelagicales bacterium]